MKRQMLILVLFVIVLLPNLSNAQGFSIQGNNELRTASGKEQFGGVVRDKNYLENRLNLDSYYGNFRMGGRLTLLRPSEFEEIRPADEILEKRYLEYSHDSGNLNIRIGDFYTVWGRGLTMALVEDIIQGYDSGLDGIQVSSHYGDIEVEGITGWSREGFLGNVKESRVHGAHVEVPLISDINLGGQMAFIRPIEDDDIATYNSTDNFGGYVSYDGSFFSIWAEHMQEQVVNVDDDFDATYLSASTYAGPMGLVVDYKNYNYYRGGGIGTSQNNSPYSQSVDILPFHSPPVVQREFTSNLFGKHPHIVRYDDEVGIQLEVSYALGYIGTAILAMSQSSRHSQDGSALPSIDEEDSPYREAFLQVNMYPTPSSFVDLWTGVSEELIYNTIGANGRDTWQRRTVLGGKVEFPLSNLWTGQVYTEGLHVNDVKDETIFYESLFTLGLIYRANYTLNVTAETSGDEDIPLGNDLWFGEDFWFNVTFRGFFLDRHELIVTYGEERGGLVCTSGKCRVVNPFNGVKVSLMTLL
ncbi:DUF6029 family protein [bacterium]|nr:DUF6029 family protein [bacterium]